MLIRALTACLILLPASAAAAGANSPKPSWAFAESRLLAEGLDPQFIRQLKATYDPKDFNEVVELNLLLYLRKKDVHRPQVQKKNPVVTVKEFIATHKHTLRLAEQKYGVHPETVSSLLWLETRHGRNQGRFHVPSVFLHLLQADRMDVVKHLKNTANKYGPVTPKVRREIDERVRSKSNWALQELKAIEKINRTRRIALKGWLGSHSGAFGMSQFLPSSYIAYAKTFRKNSWPNINRADDAIASVANYLHLNGWKKWNAKTHSKSLYRYNKSHDYVAAIMSISRKVRDPAALPD